jgi:hypothetical protein
MSEVEIKTVDTILDKGVLVPVPAPFFFRWFGKMTFNVVVRRPVTGNMLRISKMYLAMKIDQEKAGDDWRNWIEVFATAARPTSRIVAIGMLRGQFSGWLFNRPMGWWLLWHMDTRQQAELAALLVSLSGVQDFMNTIAFLRAMKMTEPRNVSP